MVKLEAMATPTKTRRIDAMIEGLTILRAAGAWDTYAEHDEFMVSFSEELSEADAAQLEQLGWRKSEDGNGWNIFV